MKKRGNAVGLLLLILVETILVIACIREGIGKAPAPRTVSSDVAVAALHYRE